MKLLNIGCGSHFHGAWTNIDVVSCVPEVTAWDVRKGLPFDDSTFDAVYHSHVIEHLAQDAAVAFMQEAVRVLKPGSVMRVVVPDLEKIARLYLDRLDAALRRDSLAEFEYDWVLLELLDQMVRNNPGGEMGVYLRNAPQENRAFIVSRIGQEAKKFWSTGDTIKRSSLIARIRAVRFGSVIEKARFLLTTLGVGCLGGGKARKAFQNGLFRNSGEIHQWMYDRFSLNRLMAHAGLAEIKVCRADESRIRDFHLYQLDIVDGIVRKPDSLFMEGVNPLLQGQ